MIILQKFKTIIRRLTMNGLSYVLLYILVQTTIFVRAPGPGDIAAAIADAVTEVSNRRNGGPALASGGGAGYGGTVGGPDEDAASGSGSVAHNPVSMYAMFSGRREAHAAVTAFGFAGDISTTANAYYAIRSGGATPDTTEFSRQMAPYCIDRRSVCNPNDRYRTADGSCNNLNNPLWGASITNQARFLSPTYGDPYNTGSVPRIRSVIGPLLPSPRDVSNAVLNGGVSPPRSTIFSVSLTHFGQFVDHDIISTPTLIDGDEEMICCNEDVPVVRPECFPFRTPPGDFQTTCMHFVRSDFGVTPGCPPESRNQINQRTSFLDLSVAYGNTLDGQNDLRELGTGRLQEGINRLLPTGPPGSECLAGEECFKSGDNRPAEVPILTVVHIAFLREHNNIVETLRALGWNDGEELYQEAKKILTGIYQHIIYTEYLPAVLGEEGMNMFGLRSNRFGFNTLYDPSANPSTRNAFGAAAYRFGHSLVGSFVESFNQDFTPRDKEPMEDHFFSTRLIRNFTTFGPDAIARWMTTQFKSRADRFLTPAIRNRLFETMPGNGFDLGSLNIQRGRDHGIPSYNRWRQFCGLQPALHFGSGHLGLTNHCVSAARALQSVYSHPDDIDLFAGGLSETIVAGALVGPTFRCIIGLQFMFFKIGDRFFYENDFATTGFTAAQLQQIKRQSLSALYCRTLDVNLMPANSFVSLLTGAPRLPCQDFPRLDLRPWSRINSSG
ncbi:peroxidase-like protein isoform X2 [Mytilus californianus]|uniref:peroxidase-like protein isoform X2 n=1 Tax=Mytilus californianus TaxID=6549 RepID=UPI002247BAF3|nr:peroxidase-like protein isoform X2 [Mytilus californianus]